MKTYKKVSLLILILFIALLSLGGGCPWFDDDDDDIITGSSGGTEDDDNTFTPMVARHIAAGEYHTLAIKDDDTLWAWGWNGAGQLGDNTVVSRTTPTAVLTNTGLTTVTAVAAGDNFSLALKTDGTIWAWGDNDPYGQLGDGTTNWYISPNPVLTTTGLTTTTAIACGEQHALALKSDGTIWAWGKGEYGQLGDNTSGGLHKLDTPTQVLTTTGLTTAVMIACGDNQSFALTSDGALWAGGDNDPYGQLGDGTLTDRLTPVRVLTTTGLTNVVAIASESGSIHSIALKNDGTVWTWGFNDDGQLGIGSADINPHPEPVQVPGLSNVVGVAAGTSHCLALKSDGTVWGWGYNFYGQLGDGINVGSFTPVQVKGPGGVGFLTGVSEIACGRNHSIALKSDGTVWTWGRNSWGQLGDGTYDDKNTPVQVFDQ